jgi:short-subunit dehydrogenase
MSVLLISRSEEKLKKQADELRQAYKAEVKYIVHDFTKVGPEKETFYKVLDEQCTLMDNDGGIGLLVNNVGIANQYPQLDKEISDKDILDMINCNMDSTVFMSRAVLKHMEKRNLGAIINVSSQSVCIYILNLKLLEAQMILLMLIIQGNLPAPYISMYSATK